ncbi:MAG: response regulator [Actinomycetota bacterium]
MATKDQPTRSQTILILDDDPDVRSLTRISLKVEGYQVLEAGTAEVALKLAAESPPDLLLLDIRLPHTDGWEVLDRLRTNPQLDGLRVIVFSAHDTGATAEKAREKGADGFLPKPYDLSDLLFAVKAALEGGHEGASVDRGAVRRNSPEAVIADHLETGEHIEVAAEALRNLALGFFEKSYVALTDRQLLILKPAWPWGWKVSSAHRRSACTLRRHKERVDGSLLLVVRNGTDLIGLYFGPGHKDQGSSIQRALEHGAEAEPTEDPAD